MAKGDAELSLTTADMMALRSMMSEVSAASAAQVASLHKCRFSGIEDSDAPQVVHALGMIADIGKGDLRGGVEEVRANHQWIATARKRVEQASMAIGLFVLTSIAGGVLAALWVGFKAAVVNAGKGQP